MKKSKFNKTRQNTDSTKLFATLAFGLPVVLMLIVFCVDGIYPFGDRSFLSTDMYHQYMPFFTEMMRAIRLGKGLDYTWNIGVGSNFLALYVYYLASPFHFLGLLVPEAHIMEFLTYLVVVKIGLCGLTSFFYFIKRNRLQTVQKDVLNRNVIALFLSLGYALSGYLAAYNWNIMWLDCIFIFPIIMLGLEELVFEGKPLMYCVALAFSIYTNYYISIMICLFLVLYFIYLFVQKISWKAIWQFAFYSLLAAGLASVLLIPEVFAIIETDFGSVSFPDKVESYFSVFDMLARHCVAVSCEKGLDHWPNIYCGAAVFLLVPLYALNDRIQARKRFGMLALSGFLLFSFSTSVLNFIWHGLNYPDSLPARQSFIYIFLVLIMCFDGICNLDFSKQEQKKQLLHVYIGVVVCLLAIEKFAEHEDVVDFAEWLTFLFVTIYAVIGYLLYLAPNKLKKSLLLYFAVVAMATEVCLNTGFTSVSNINRANYLEHLEDHTALYAWSTIKEDSFYRLGKFKRKTKNDGALSGYPTASVFSSTMNSAVMEFYKRLGMRHSKVYYDYDGTTAFTSALLNVNYVYGETDEFDNSIFRVCDESGDIYLYEAQYKLPFGYVAPTGYDLPEGYKDSGLRLQNQMVHDLGIDELLFENCESSNSGDDVNFVAPKDGIYYGILTASGTTKVKVLGGNPSEIEWNDLKTGSVIYMGSLKAGTMVDITNNDKDDTSKKIAVSIYRMDEAVLDRAIQSLSQTALQNVKFDSTHMAGNISMSEAGRLILSVPYEKGWTVRVNGEEVSPELFGGAFMAFDLEPGEYELAMQYVPYGKNIGRWVSVISVLVFACVLFGQRKFTKDK